MRQYLTSPEVETSDVSVNSKGRNKSQITSICANPGFHERIAGCLYNGWYKRGSKRGKKLQTRKEKAEGEERHEIAGQGDRTTLCGWSNQALICPQGMLEAFTKLFLVPFSIFQKLKPCTFSNGTFIYIFIYIYFRKGLHVLHSWTKFCTNHQAICFCRLAERVILNYKLGRHTEQWNVLSPHSKAAFRVMGFLLFFRTDVCEPNCHYHVRADENVLLSC